MAFLAPNPLGRSLDANKYTSMRFFRRDMFH